MSTSLRLPQTRRPLAERNPGPRQLVFTANEGAFVATESERFGGLRQEFPVCGKGGFSVAITRSDTLAAGRRECSSHGGTTL
jgi:hypothetical protein